MCFVIHIAKYHPTPNFIQKCLMQVVGTFQKVAHAQSALERTFYFIQLPQQRNKQRKCAAELWSKPLCFKDAARPPGVSVPSAPGAPRPRQRARATGGQDGPGRDGDGGRAGGRAGDRRRRGRVGRAGAGPCCPLPPRAGSAAGPPPRGLRGLRERRMLPQGSR